MHRTISRFAFTLIATMNIGVSFAYAAQDTTPATEKPRPVYSTVRATAAPAIDGDLSDPVWATAPEITGFTQMDPEEGKPAKNDTKVRIVYTDDAIYFGLKMEDEAPSTPLLARRDSDLNNGDYFRISIDSQQDRLNGAAFVVNASNVQMDMTLYNDIYNDNSWDAVWESATKILDKGWTAEVRIPFSQLRFPDKPVHTWGFNISRWNVRNKESTRLVFSPKTVSGFVSRFADLTGIQGIKPKRSFEVMPYGVARTDVMSRFDNPFIAPSAHRMDGGVDVKYGLTSSLTLTGTINPDFGQVEVDPAVINLSAFETFFPEKRPFFTEGANVFTFGSGPSNSRWGFNMSFPTFFYSRRIGRSPQGFVDPAFIEGRPSGVDFTDAPGETTILGAAKVTGKIGKKWTVGLLDAITDRETAWYRIGDRVGQQTVEPMTNYLVARATREYGKDSRVGFMFTSTNRRLSDNLEPRLRENAFFAGVDGYTLFKDKAWILEWLTGSTLVTGAQDAIASTQRSSARYFQRPDAGHVEYDPTRESLSGYMGRIMLNKQKGKWRPNLQIQAQSPGFELNDVGFQSRVDNITTHGVLHYLDTDVKKHTREISAWVGKYQNWNFDGDMTANGVSSGFYMQFTNYWAGEAWAGGRDHAIDDQKTRGGPVVIGPQQYYYGGGFGNDSRKKLSFWVWGEHVVNSDGGGGDYTGLTFTYRPSPAVKLQLTPSYSDARGAVQYVARIADGTYAPTFGDRYVFATIDQKTLELGMRAEWTLNARLSLQMFLQPFVSSGDYHGFKQLTRARDDEYTPLDAVYHEASDAYSVAGGSPISFGDPDFNFRSVRGSAVLRWEFRPGSALYVAWNENRSDVAPIGDFRFRRDLSALPDAQSADVFMVKVSYWLPM
jgi:Domain of unknown function (DUF5916)/Carbohydrate family 9 binding domain-like